MLDLIEGKFQMGQLGMTPNAHMQIAEHVGTSLFQDTLVGILNRHVSGDWGVVDRHDYRVNNRAVREGTRILSAYDLPDSDNPDNKLRVWIITEADRRHTTILLPEDY